MEDSKKPFKDERQKTDHSLIAERGKTDESFGQSRDHTERLTDQKVENERHDSDEATSQSRTETDRTRDRDRGIVGNTLLESQHRSDERVDQERHRADQATELERAHMDAAIEKERSKKDAFFHDLLGRERQETDKNLLDERDKTDRHTDQSSALLSNALKSHLDTKGHLTSHSEFLAIVSHDLRSPIGAVSTCAEMLLEITDEKVLSPKARHWVQFMKRNADTAIRLIVDLLDMERIAEGKLQLGLETHCVGEVIREAVESFVHAAASKGVLLRNIPENFSEKMVFDRDRITQVMTNLVGNALKFTPEGGSIAVSVLVGERNLRVSVKDTGPGIPENRKVQIFKRLAQIETRDRRGLGLGLHISKMLVEAHHGTIGVNSVEGQGSEFYFEIPRLVQGL